MFWNSLKLLVTSVAFLVLTASLASTEEIEELATVCANCHGKDGRPTASHIPIIWGQHEGYIYIQLKDYQSGLRKNVQMNPIAAKLSKDDMKALAAHFSKKPWPRTTFRASEEDEKAGLRVETAGLCTECHLDNFVGTSIIPRTSGQTVTYLEKVLLAFKSRERINSPDKATLLATFPEEDLKAMARYLAGIHVQPQ